MPVYLILPYASKCPGYLYFNQMHSITWPHPYLPPSDNYSKLAPYFAHIGQCFSTPIIRFKSLFIIDFYISKKWTFSFIIADKLAISLINSVKYSSGNIILLLLLINIGISMVSLSIYITWPLYKLHSGSLFDFVVCVCHLKLYWLVL